MHFALPPRKTSNPPPYARHTSRSPLLRRNRLQQIALLGIILLVFYYFLAWILSSSSDRPPAGTPEVVIVTPFDYWSFGEEYIAKIKKNREVYAERHGYKTFFPSLKDYDTIPVSWGRVPAMRHAMALNPYTPYFLYIDQRALIMNTSLSLPAHIMSPTQLERLMLKDVPVVPPDSVIRTFSHTNPDQVDLVLAQAGDGLGRTSMIVRQGDWAKFFLDSWFDPLYRSYNFKQAEAHALEHILQWHPTMLAKLALVPERTMSSCSVPKEGKPGDNCLFQPGDFVVQLVGCDKPAGTECQQELDRFYKIWQDGLAAA